MADPWAGSFFIERLTAEMESRAAALVEEVEAMGGMTAAVIGGLPKVRLQRADAPCRAVLELSVVAQDLCTGPPCIHAF